MWLKGLTWREAPGNAAELPKPFCQESTSLQKARVSSLAPLVPRGRRWSRVCAAALPRLGSGRRAQMQRALLAVVPAGGGGLCIPGARQSRALMQTFLS